jgi:polyisoprenoid-binding protein YceI
MTAPTTAPPEIVVPAPGRYEIDPVHTAVGFVARHLVVSKVRGRFTVVTGTVTIADPIERSHVEVEIAADSIATGIAARDEHLRSDDFFAAVAHPTITFRSTAVRPAGSGACAGIVTGDLTIRGTTHPVTLDVAFLPRVDDRSLTLRAGATVEREDWGLTWNEVAPTGGLLIGRRVDLELRVHAVSAP